MLAGDVMLGRGVDQIQRKSVDPVIYEEFMRSARGYVTLAEQKSGSIPRKVAPDYVWGDALQLIRKTPTARIVNLETAVTTSAAPWPGKGINYRMHPANVAVLNAAHIDVAVLSNNHVIDWGRYGLVETLNSLHNANLKTAGAGVDLASAAAPAVIDVPDGRVLVFAMCDVSSGLPPAWRASPDQPGVNLLADLSHETALRIARDIKSFARRPGDRVIASIHWGGNWGYDISSEQQQFAKTLIDDGGVDIVHGHSSHHPKGVERYHDRLIIYGAGDLINDYEGIGGYEEFRPELTLIYLPSLAVDGRLTSLRLVPMRVQKFRLHCASPEETEWLRERMTRESHGVRFATTPEGLIAQ